MWSAPFDRVDHDRFLVATTPPDPQQARAAGAVVLFLLVTLAVTAPFASIPIANSEAFLPAYATAVLINDLITSILLFLMFSIQRSWAMLLLATGYLFAALTAVPWALTFPGVFPPLGPLNEGVQVTAWIAAVRRVAFPGFVLCYVLLKDAPLMSARRPSVRRIVALSVTGAVVATIGLTWAFIAADQMMPRFMNDARNTTSLWIYVPSVATALGLFTLALLWLRLRSILDLWLLVVIFTFLVELLLLSFLSSGRFSVGWWSGRFFGLVSATVVLVVLLAETTTLHAQLARALATERREREGRLATMEALSAAIAHEVNQPLGSMVTNADAALRWLQKRPPDIEEARAALGRIIADGHRAGEVVQSIRSLFREDRREHGPLDVNVVIGDALAAVRADARLARVDLRTALDPNLPAAVGDAVQIRHVVANLLCNALQAVDAAPDAERAVLVRSEADGMGSVLVSVEDGGTGLDQALRERIFEPFFTTKAHGMGLGLMFCRSVVEAHGGRLWVTENVPRGAVFRFTLPAALPTATVPTATLPTAGAERA
ncbi:signal transduction histidine kinase [Constrictibacter sp. MBR-5]|jgi:signal transduction histidine kinase